MKRVYLACLLLVGACTCVLAQDAYTSASQVQQPLKRMVQIDGFRVQIYYGGNTHQDKTEAKKMENRARTWFDEYPVYTTFVAPHWVCRVGNFRSRTEAQVLLKKMRDSRRFPGAVIVKSKVKVPRVSVKTEESDSDSLIKTTTD